MSTSQPRNEPKWFRRTLINAIILPFILMFVLTGILLWQIQNLLSAFQWVDHTDQVIAQAHLVQELLIDQETGLRGYLVTAQADFLQPYQRGADISDDALDKLERMVQDNPTETESTRQIHNSYAQWHSYAKNLIDVREHDGNYQQLVLQRTGKRLMDDMRKQITTIISNEEMLRDQRGQNAREATQQIVNTTIISTLLLGLLMALFIRRQILALSQRYSTALNVAEQRAAELSKSEQQFRMVSEMVPQMIWTTRPDGYHEYFNQRWYSYTGTTLEQVRGEGWMHVLHPDDVASTGERWTHSLRSGEPYEIEYRFKDASSGAYRWFLGRALPMRDADGAIISWFGTCTDIDEQKQTEEQLRERTAALARATTALEERNRELDQFAYITSHDLKAPLRGIANLSQWIEEDLGEHATEDIRKQLDLLRGRVHRMEALIDGILQYSRIGRIKGQNEHIDIGELLHAIVDLQAPPPGFQIVVEPPMPTLHTERLRLEQVFANLINNAIKHSSRPDGCIRISARDIGPMYEFAVADNGPGIAPQYHERIFVIFQTLASRDQVEGSGLGLSLVKKIVELFGGTIRVESEEGAGATFFFTWPKVSA